MRCHRQSLWLFLDNCKVVERRGRVFPKDSMSRFFPLCLSVSILLLVRLQDRPLSSDLFRWRGGGAAVQPSWDGTEELRAASRSECAKSPLTYL